MAHHSTQTTMSAAERQFEDLMQHGDDLLKIELLRPAKQWYERALSLNIQTEEVKKKIATCERLLVFERKVILILVAIASVIVLGIILF